MNRYMQSVVALAAWVLTPAAVLALGFQNPDQGARATGQGEAFVAQADDASAIYYNPAGLTRLQGTELTSGGYLAFGRAEFDGPAGDDAMSKTTLLPHFYVATDFGLERWRFGLGANIPFGSSVDWSKTGPLQFIVTDSNLMVINIQPTVAYQLTEHLSLGAGLNIYQGQTKLEENLNPFVVPGGGRFRFQGDGTAVGATVGLLWTINEKHAVGVLYRSPFTIVFEDEAVVRDNPIPFLNGSGDAKASINFPQSVKVGYAFRPTPAWKLEADIEWVNWNTLNNVRMHWPSSPLPPFSSVAIPFHWMDSYYYEFGAQYQFQEHWVARAGYIFSTKTVPDRSYSPAQPDNDRHVFSAGLGYAAGRFQVDVVYQFTLMENRLVTGSGDLDNNGVAGDTNGRWKSRTHALMLTSTIKF